jgi:hypothetical protein
MAEKPKKVALIKQLTPNSIVMTIDGQEVRVAMDKEENAILNMILASQGRSLIQRALKHWQEQDQIPLPKELRDIAGAMRDIAAFSAEVYATAAPPNTNQEKPVEVTEINFDDLNKKPEEPIPNEPTT